MINGNLIVSYALVIVFDKTTPTEKSIKLAPTWGLRLFSGGKQQVPDYSAFKLPKLITMLLNLRL